MPTESAASRGGADGEEGKWFMCGCDVNKPLWNECVVHELDEITGSIVDSAVRIHKELGPGLLESVNEVVLAEMLAKRDSRWCGRSQFASNTTA